MNTIKNIHKLSEIVSPEILVKLDKGANLHLRHANVEFKIISVENTCITIRTVQGKHMSENYADLQKLISITKNLFESLILGYTFKVHAIPYSPAETDIVNAKWINDQMLKCGVRVKDIQDETGIDKTSISAWINEKKPLSQVVKAMLYFYFQTKPELKPYRLGNIVKGIDRPYVILDQITDKRIQGSLNTNTGFYMSGWIPGSKNLKPIEINKDWLIKLGFRELEFSVGNHNLKFVQFEKNKFACRLLTENTLVTYSNKTLFFVHELQNEYFYETGEELTIENF